MEGKKEKLQIHKQDDILDGPEETNSSHLLKVSRENQQLLLYIFVTLIVIFSWILGLFGCSFIWIFGLVVLTFLIWRSKVIQLTEQHIRHAEAVVHRKRALKGHCETTEWVNFFINRWWVFSSGSIEDLIKKHLNPLLLDMKPKFIDSITLKSFTLGDNTPFIKFVRVFEHTFGENKSALSWQSVGRPPAGLPQLGQHGLIVEADVGLQCDDFKMVFATRLGGKMMGLTVDVVVEKLHLDGNLQMALNMNSQVAFPHFTNAVFSFQTRPEVWFSVRVLKTLHVMEVPVLKSWIHSLVMDALTHALVDPAKLDISLASTGPGTFLPNKTKDKKLADGVLTITLTGESGKSGVFNEDQRYCSLVLGDQKEHTRTTSGPQKWQDTCSLLVDDVKRDVLVIKCKTKRMFTTYTIAQFDLTLADYPFEHQSNQEEHLQKKGTKGESAPAVMLDLQMTYTPLPPINLEHMSEVKAEQEVAGVMYVCIHEANNLLALDRTGTSDPYCILFNNGHKVKTTHYVCGTRNPQWETSAEFLVGDFTKTILSFIIYDWDGHDASESDFLGSAFVVLSPEEPCVVRRCLALGYNVMNLTQGDPQLGSLVVSAVFRPVSSVSRADLMKHNTPSMAQYEVQDKNKNIITKMIKPIKKSLSSQASIGDIISLGHGIMELNLIKAKELVAKDSNGFSDPFCEVRVGNERKFTSSIKRKTLNPVWDEWVTLQMPAQGEQMEIVVWDKDPFFKKDFLGSITFTLEELKKHNTKESRWYKLQRIESGQLQLYIQLMSEEHPPSQPSTPNSLSVTNDTVVPPPIIEEEDDVFKKDTIPSIQINGKARIDSGHSTSAPERSASDVSPGMLERQGGLRHRRSSSVASLRSSSKNAFVRSTVSRSSLSSALESVSSLTSSFFRTGEERKIGGEQVGTKYFQVRGQVLSVRGLTGGEGKIYCKIRLDNRPRLQQNRKPSKGKVIRKSGNLESQRDLPVNLAFDVDRGEGVLQDSTIIFVIKHSRRESIAQRGFQLQFLLGDATEVTKWLALDHRVEVEVKMSATIRS